MLQSNLFIKTLKENPKDETSINAKLLIRGGFIDKLYSGIYTFLPLGLLVIKKIENIIREEMLSLGGQEIYMPALHPKENWETTGRWSSMDDLYKIKDSSGKEFALGGTHEEIVSPLVKKFIQSYRDLPFSVFQFQTKFRMELRAKSGILRGREFLMKDLYSFHEDEKSLERFYNEAIKAYRRIFIRVGIGDFTHLTFASGGSFSKYSHEFQTITSSGEDIIYICKKCDQAINREIKEEVPSCPVCGNSDFKEEKSVEVGNIFKLGTKYSHPFNLKVSNENGEKKDVIMGCYGIGLSRLLGTVVEINNDKKGIIWPENISPFKVHLLFLEGGDKKAATLLYEKLKKSKIETLYDDRPGISAGEKFADADLLGIPFRVVISERTGEKAEIKRRIEPEAKLVSTDNLLETLKEK